jgi:hypothetical protein
MVSREIFMRPTPWSISSMLVPLLLVSCGDSNTTTTPDAADVVDIIEVLLPDVAEDSLVSFDTALPSDASEDTTDAAAPDADCIGCTGAPCDDNADCNSGYCIEGANGRECARTCLSECPTGYGCRSIQSAGGDPVFVCVYDHITYCQPCDTDPDCETGLGGISGARCVPEDADDPSLGRFCRTPCTPGTCPDGATCEDYEGAMVCRPGEPNEARTCACSARAVSLGSATTCGLTNASGTCPGERLCLVAGDSATTCDADLPADELCNGKDDDCDSATDEAFPDLGKPCDGDDADLCAGGTWGCGEDGGIRCTDDAASETELCNGGDDDCDGATDEDFPTLGRACDGTDADQCSDGVFACDGLGVICNDDVRTVAELCNGRDDDCDGVADDGFDLNVACDGDGDADLCADGIKVCAADGSATTCSDAPGGFIELCNELDDDCRNGPDDTFPDKYKPCDGNDADVCKDGVLVCSVDGLGLSCTDDGVSKIEICNELDDDCDGQVDEDFPQKGTACDSPVDTDSCKTGTWVCQANAIACTDDAASITESCNGVDDDCDGSTDAADPDLIAPFNPNQLGQCAGTRQKCNGAAGFGASYTTVPGFGLAETPDASFLDENCDGLDGDEAQAVFVRAGNADTGTCTKAAPCGSLTYAITQTTAAKKHVYVQAGTYTGIVEVPSGKNVEIYGGFNANWVRKARTEVGHKVTLRGAKHATENEYMTVRVRSATLKMADLYIEAPSPGATERKDGRGMSSYGVHAVSSTATLERVEIIGGNGASGAAGTVGVDAASTVAPEKAPSGGAAQQGFDFCENTSRGLGASGRSNNTCPANTAGGRGGNGGTKDSNCPCVFGGCWNATNGAAGSPGSGTVAGGGGAGGTGSDSCSGVGNGGAGGTPSHGTGGNGGGRGGSVSSNFWAGGNGLDGTLGSHGSGGGGGGGSGGCDNGTDGTGAGGGGGGAGGCAATAGGLGGKAGGLSVAVFTSGGTLTIRDCRIIRGNGGAGGSGGAGGRGQPGGEGGDGGVAQGQGQAGGRGGRGGDGGASGGGGGGAGGGSYGIFSLTTTVNATNVSYEGGAAGAGGAGGDAPAAAGVNGDGKAGQAGVVSNTRTCTAAGACGD